MTEQKHLDRVVTGDSPECADNAFVQLKVEPWTHQARLVRAIIDFEACQSDMERSNRLKVALAAGAGKTFVTIALIALAPRVSMRSIWFEDPHSSCRQERIFPPDRVIQPTVIVVRASTHEQWVSELDRFSRLRVLVVRNLATLTSAVAAIREDLALFNASYDVILVNNTTTTGNLDKVLGRAGAVFAAMVKTHALHVVMLNALSRYCFGRIVYDDAEFHIRISPFENALSCIYMSATHAYGTLSGRTGLVATSKDGSPITTLECALEFATYHLSANVLDSVPIISVDATFLEESLHLGRGYGLVPGSDSVQRSAMPAEPEIYIVHVNTGESKKIDIIDMLCDDVKIMEGVNSLERREFGAIIRDLMAERFVPYKRALTIIAHYEAIDISALAALPAPPLGVHFTEDSISRCEPIEYGYRDIGARVNAVVAKARGVVNAERALMDRVRGHLADTDCGICMNSLRDGASVIMTCCNAILHYACALKCRAGTCPFCRARYTRDAFVAMHHETDASAFAAATTAQEELVAISATAGPTEITKLSILNDLLANRRAGLDLTRVRLREHGALLFSEDVKAECEVRHAHMKALVYCSAAGTLRVMEDGIEVDHTRLTRASGATFRKIMHFNSAAGPTALLADTWKDAAGINFRMATDLIVLNYVHDPAAIEQMFGRGLRAGREGRLRIWLIAFGNERAKWLDRFMVPFAEPPTGAASK